MVTLCTEVILFFLNSSHLIGVLWCQKMRYDTQNLISTTISFRKIALRTIMVRNNSRRGSSLSYENKNRDESPKQVAAVVATCGSK
jgi:hypothetical protein